MITVNQLNKMTHHEIKLKIYYANF